mmetsp:Transcript_23667/g.37906  ORF Transcript_23667/g.37906 Transcript_23667/m.37906 type:complete len:334 (-) Transcript_23667:1129-2130(-)
MAFTPFFGKVSLQMGIKVLRNKVSTASKYTKNTRRQFSDTSFGDEITAHRQSDTLTRLRMVATQIFKSNWNTLRSRDNTSSNSFDDMDAGNIFLIFFNLRCEYCFVFCINFGVLFLVNADNANRGFFFGIFIYRRRRALIVRHRYLEGAWCLLQIVQPIIQRRSISSMIRIAVAKLVIRQVVDIEFEFLENVFADEFFEAAAQMFEFEFEIVLLVRLKHNLHQHFLLHHMSNRVQFLAVLIGIVAIRIEQYLDDFGLQILNELAAMLEHDVDDRQVLLQLFAVQFVDIAEVGRVRHIAHHGVHRRGRRRHAAQLSERGRQSTATAISHISQAL